MFARSLRLLAFFSCTVLAAHAGNLVTLKVTPLSSVAAGSVSRSSENQSFVLAGKTLPLGRSLEGQAVPDLDPALAPLTAVEQDGAVFLLARDAAGKEILLRHVLREGWKPCAEPPEKLQPVGQPIGQSHVFFVSAPAKEGELKLWAYHTITNTWAVHGKWTSRGNIVSLARSPNGFVVTTKDGNGEPQATQVELVSAKRGLKTIDYVVIFIYLCVVAGIGLYFYLTGKKDPTNFFVAGRRIPWWAAGLSLYATGTSAISYLAIPAKSYATDWLYLSQNFITFFGTIYVGFYVVPLVRRLNLISVYEYLEMRFHPTVRMMASLICIVQHLAGRMSVVLLLPALALSAVTGVGVTTSVLVMGIITTIYTVLGGMKAVIWTDVLQVFVMVGGALFAITWMVHGAGGFGEVVRIALADHKTHLFDWSFDLTLPSIWVSVMILVVGTLTWPQDQVMTQRVLSTKDDRAARGSLFMLTALALPGSVMFFSVGTALYAYYKVHPAELNPLLTTDQIFPQFIASDLPAGVTGLIIAGIFAASMATLSSNINSIATLVSVDFYERYAKKASAAKSVRLAEWVTVFTGIAGTGLALYLSSLDLKSIWDKFIELMALLGGGFSGIYALGMFTRRANWQGCVIGIVASIVMTILTKLFTPLHVWMYLVVSVGSCIVFGYLGSWLFPASTRSLKGLTVFDQLKTPLSIDATRRGGH
ncbi:MAG: transporter, solute:sodium symporter family [Verrucomicrobia bacterium]|nr:transporter, solute:sodium symporter family [Verrucomicrobiota bacterium]